MIVLSGVQEFPSGLRTQELAARFADRIGAELEFASGEPARQAVAELAEAGDVLILGHAPSRRIPSALREAPCPVVIAPPGVSTSGWREVVLGSYGDGDGESAAATAGVLAARLDARLRLVLVRPDERDDELEEHVRRLGGAALSAVGAPLAMDAELRVGPPAMQLLRAVGEDEAALIVIAADPPPGWRDRLRAPSTVALVHGSRAPVVVVPPGTGPRAARATRGAPDAAPA